MLKITEKTQSIDHFLQSKDWQKVKARLGNGNKDLKFGWMQINKIPLISKSIGYIPRLSLDIDRVEQIVSNAKEANCAWIQIDPISIYNDDQGNFQNNLMRLGYTIKPVKPIQLQNTVMFDLSLPEEKLISNMKSKYRYNCRVAEKHCVTTRFGTSEDDFKTFLNLYLGTKSLHHYFGRGEAYLKQVWDIIKNNSSENELKPVFAIAEFKNQPIVAWFIFIYKGIAYLPYAGSAREFQNTKATYKIVSDTLIYLKSIGVKIFDFYGIEETSEVNDGFSSYKKGFGGEIVKYDSSYAIVLNNKIFALMQIALKLREKFQFIKRIK